MWDPPGTNIYEEDAPWKYLLWRHQINLGVIFASCQSRIKSIVVDVSVVGGSGGPRAIQVICKDVNNDRDDIRAVNQAPSLSCWRRRWPLHHLLPSISISNAADSASIHSFASAPLSPTSAPFRNSNLNLSPKTLPPISAAAPQWPSAAAAAYHLMMRSVHRWIVHHCRRYHPRRWCIIHNHEVDKTVNFFATHESLQLNIFTQPQLTKFHGFKYKVISQV